MNWNELEYITFYKIVVFILEVIVSVLWWDNWLIEIKKDYWNKMKTKEPFLFWIGIWFDFWKIKFILKYNDYGWYFNK